MNAKTASLLKAMLISLVLLGLHACASVSPEVPGHEGGIVGTGSQVDCSQAENKHKQACSEPRP